MNNINFEMKLDLYKQLYTNGIWNKEMLDYLKEQGTITKEEYVEILKQPREKTVDTRTSEETFTYEIWDKKSPINGVDAEEILKDNMLKNASDVILIKSPNTDNNNVLYVESVDTLKINNRLRGSLTADEVAQFQIERLEEMRNQPPISIEQINVGHEIFVRTVETEKSNQTILLLNDIKTLLTDIKTLLSDK